VFLSTRKTASQNQREEKDEYQNINSNNVSFDSGYFGTNSSPTTIDNSMSGISVQNNNRKIVSPTIKRKESFNPSKNNDTMEIHSVKYRCIPVYQPEYVKTATIHSKETLSVIDEQKKKYETDNLHKKWGSQTIEPTQPPVEYLPRSVEFVNIIKEKFHQERDRKIEILKKESQLVTTSTAKELKQVRSQSCNKHYPIERRVIGIQSPKYQRRANFGTLDIPAKIPCNSNTVYDTKKEKNKVSAFAQTLENATWRKKTVTASNW